MGRSWVLSRPLRGLACVCVRERESERERERECERESVRVCWEREWSSELPNLHPATLRVLSFHGVKGTKEHFYKR